MKQEYILVHDTRPAAAGITLPPLAGAAVPLAGAAAVAGARSAATAAPEIRIDVETLSDKHAREAQAQPGTFAAPKMATRLIEPRTMNGEAITPSWGIEAVGASTSSSTGEGVKVAILDTGINREHDAFNGIQIEEKDFSGSGNGDVQGHGTHVAGTVFGRDVAGTRIGVAPGVTQAMIGKVLGDDGSGSSEMIFRGIQWALNGGAKVINMSLGFDFPGHVKRLVELGVPTDLATSMALKAYADNANVFEALMALVSARVPMDGGAVVVAAAGNESERQIDPDYEISVSLPAATPSVLSVGAVRKDQNGLSVADFSNTNPLISAPGVGIVSADAAMTDDVRNLQGTSMAAPHVAGCAALWWQRVRELHLPPTADTVTAKLMALAELQPFVSDVDPSDRGIGLVQAPN